MANLGEPIKEITVTPKELPIPQPMPQMPAPVQEPVPV
jgi:hypothetical protein